jgi:hypothetical protein
MPTLTRRRDGYRKDCWRIYFGDVHVGDIDPRAGVPTSVDQWEWYCGFGPPARRGLKAAGTAVDLPDAREKFKAAWRELSPTFTDDDFAAYRYERAWTEWKVRMQETRHKLPTQVSRGRSRCFCGASIGINDMAAHVRNAHINEAAHV